MKGRGPYTGASLPGAFISSTEKKHRIPMDTLVQIQLKDSDRDGLRLFVVRFERDELGEATYALSFIKGITKVLNRLYKLKDALELSKKDPKELQNINIRIFEANCRILSGFTEDCLTIVD